MVAGGLQLLQALVPACLLEDVDGGWHIGCRAVAVEVSPVRSRRDRSEFIELPFRLHAIGTPWVPPLRIERRLFLDRRTGPFFKHGDAELFLARRDGRVVGRVSAQIDHAFNEYHDNAWGMFGFLEFEDDQEVLDALLDAAARWLRRPRARAHGGADGLHHERRVRDPDRGLRARPDGAPALAPALLPGAVRASRSREGDGPADVGDGDRPAGEDPADHLRAGRGARAQARDHDPQDEPTPPAARAGPLRRALQRGLGEELGLRAVLQGGPRRVRAGPAARLRQVLVHGRRDRRRGRRSGSRSRSPTSTRCSSA